jgi:hypothetical protein
MNLQICCRSNEAEFEGVNRQCNFLSRKVLLSRNDKIDFFLSQCKKEGYRFKEKCPFIIFPSSNVMANQ